MVMMWPLPLTLITALCYGLAVGHGHASDRSTEIKGPQKLVTWDEHSLFVKGERAMIYSGEFHPFRLPLPSLWLDVFQKLKAAGLNTVSYYNMWALNEQERGKFCAEGVFDMAPFFEAAMASGMYLIAVSALSDLFSFFLYFFHKAFDFHFEDHCTDSLKETWTIHPC